MSGLFDSFAIYRVSVHAMYYKIACEQAALYEESVLIGDVTWAMSRESFDGSARSALVRAVFALIEGSL